jgi:hypothetical protein
MFGKGYASGCGKVFLGLGRVPEYQGIVSDIFFGGG